VFAAGSSINLTPARAEAVLRRQALLRGGLAALMVAWAVVSLLGLPPLDAPLPEEASRGPLTALAVAGVALYTLAAVRYWLLYRRRPSVILIAILTAFALLAEAMIAVALARNWHASWWEWHLLMAFAFAFVYYSAHVQYAREGSWSSLFRGIYLQETIEQIRREHTAALEALVEAMQRPQGDGAERPVGRVVADLAERFDLTEGQASVLEQAAQALVAEREQIERLRALVAVGAEARVIVDERHLLERGVELTGQALRPDALRVGLVEGEQLVFPSSMRAEGWPEGGPEGSSSEAIALRLEGDGDGEQPADDGGDPAGASLKSLEPVEETEDGGGRLVLPLTVKDRPAGVLDVRRAEGPFADRDRWLLRALASQLSIGLENARLYRQLDGLFRQYMSPDVATALLADPTQAALGGDVAEVTVLFADLRGFTPFSERASPERVVAMLNQYFGRAVPVLLANGGTVVQFVGDAVMACSTPPPASPTTPCGRPGRPLAYRRRSRRWPSASPTGPGSGSGSTPGPPSSATSAATSCATSPPSATPSTWAPASSRRSPRPARWCSATPPTPPSSTWPSPDPSTPSRSRASATPSPAGSSRASRTTPPPGPSPPDPHSRPPREVLIETNVRASIGA
jgi:class 3 adenylate cyclase